MTLDQALRYAQQKLNEGHESDGCTMAPDLGIKQFCIMHDFLRRFKPVTTWRADKLFFQGIMTKGRRYFPIAVTYWAAVRVASLWYA